MALIQRLKDESREEEAVRALRVHCISCKLLMNLQPHCAIRKPIERVGKTVPFFLTKYLEIFLERAVSFHGIF